MLEERVLGSLRLWQDNKHQTVCTSLKLILAPPKKQQLVITSLDLEVGMRHPYHDRTQDRLYLKITQVATMKRFPQR